MTDRMVTATDDDGVGRPVDDGAPTHGHIALSRPTLGDVAREAGVSRSTVSLVIRDGGRISPATRKHVRDVIKRLGYVYNRGAASLRDRTSKSIGVVMPNTLNLFNDKFTQAFDLHMHSRGFVALTCHSLEDPDRQNQLIRSLLERGVDAIVLMPAVGSDDVLLPVLSNIDVPVVIVARRFVDNERFTFVGPDNALAGKLAATHLIEHGCRSIGYVGGSERVTPRLDRVKGVRAATRRTPARLTIDLPCDQTGAGGIAAMESILESGDIPDGIICHNDATAFGIFRALRTGAPELIGSLRVIGFDDVAEAALWEPPLTTLATDAEGIGRRAADLLMRKMAGHDADPSVVISPRLVVRESCGCHAQPAAGARAE